MVLGEGCCIHNGSFHFIQETGGRVEARDGVRFRYGDGVGVGVGWRDIKAIISYNFTTDFPTSPPFSTVKSLSRLQPSHSRSVSSPPCPG